MILEHRVSCSLDNNLQCSVFFALLLLLQAVWGQPDPPVVVAHLEPKDGLDTLDSLVVREALDRRAHLDRGEQLEWLAFPVVREDQVDLVRTLFW